MREPLVEVKDLCKFFFVGNGLARRSCIHAVDHVNFTIYQGETLGLVGESGCGKSTLGRTILRLYKPTSGQVFYAGRDITRASRRELRQKMQMQMVFQDPSASLNPRMTIGKIVEEPLKNYRLCANKREREERVIELLARVGLNQEQMHRYPHEFSGGQQQRVGISRTLAANPEFIVCDEPISALDVSIQSQIINMLEDMQRELGLTYLFIAHDVSVVRHISNRIGVMFLGKLVELADSNELVRNPLHPYTQTLMSAVPIPDPDVTRSKKRMLLAGELPSPIDPPPGCRFASRCPYAKECGGKCTQEEPPMKELSPGHYAACWLL